MTDTPAPDAPAPAWSELLREGRTLYVVLVVLGAALYALQILVIAIIMPTVVGDIGGAAYYTWPAMLYTIGAIVGAASVGPLWARFGARRAYAISGAVFLIGTLGCALAPDMAALIAARAVQGYAGGLVIGGGMALISAAFDARLRTRILALYQGTWMVSQLLGPAFGGLFAEIDWWRGSFWAMTPILLIFVAITWAKVPDRLGDDAARKQPGGFPAPRLALLASGVFCIALAGPVEDPAARAALIVAAVVLVWTTFRIDRASKNPLYPSAAFSARSPVGLALWILFAVGAVQTTVSLFLPLLLQVSHGITPLFVSVVTMVISAGWTVGTFTVSGWTGARERLALWIGPLLMLAGLTGMIMTAQTPAVAALILGAFVFGLGIGTHNVHLLARTMAAADPGEERITSAAMPSFRSLGTAFGAALAGMLSAVAGLDNAMAPDAVRDAVTLVYSVNLVPTLCMAVFMFMLVRLGRKPAGEAA